jgi:4-hydroxyphenylpyruvate dioxygenase-like putative hemolysin
MKNPTSAQISSPTNCESNNDTHRFQAIDHIAIAVEDLEGAIELFRDVLGFSLVREIHVKGVTTGMRSAEFEANGIRFVLCKGTEPQSQVSQLVSNFGVGVAHIALAVDNVDDTVVWMKENGMEFDTGIIRSPGLTQAFSSRSKITGLSIEVISRNGVDGFADGNIQELFEQLESSGRY